MGKCLVTVGQWRKCVRAKACDYVPNSSDDAPVNNVSWTDAQQFVAWLPQATRQRYRLPSEGELGIGGPARAQTRAARPGKPSSSCWVPEWLENLTGWMTLASTPGGLLLRFQGPLVLNLSEFSLQARRNSLFRQKNSLFLGWGQGG